MKITSLNKIAPQEVSHNPKISKQVFISEGQIPHLTQYARAIFPPGEIASKHIHQDMYEIFYVEKGRGEISVNNEKFDLSEGICVTVEPGEKHDLINTGEDNLIVILTGVQI